MTADSNEVGHFAGRHVLAELTDVDAAKLDNEEFLRSSLETALTEAGATVLNLMSHKFDPQGVTMLALLAESHASIHTYPEHGCAFLDFFTCGEQADPEKAAQLFATAVGGTLHSKTVGRGLNAPAAVMTESVGEGMTRSWEMTEVVVDANSTFQHYTIGRTAQGLSLFCDEERQSTEQTQLIYHEALMIPAMVLAEKLERVLIIGSSEGVASQLAVAAGATVVDHVDIDQEVVEVCARELPYGYTPSELAKAVNQDGPIRVHYRDGWEFLAEAAAGTDRYDVVVIDLPDETTDPEAQHNRLYGLDFLANCAAVLAPGGVVSTQAGCPTVWRNETLKLSWERFTRAFGTVAYYGSDEHEWAFVSARQDTIESHGGVGGTEAVLAAMCDRLERLPYRPESIDTAALRSNATPPMQVRQLSLVSQ
ncbi:MAG: adenosylmethionine decarboxylase [Nocardiaceae bacterium]|nr:adenosylmethionine decarboxylase [Nocardiaceae bacterium]